MFTPGCKHIFLQLVGSGTEGSVSVSTGMVQAVCQPLAVSGPLYLGLGYSPVKTPQHLILHGRALAVHDWHREKDGFKVFYLPWPPAHAR